MPSAQTQHRLHDRSATEEALISAAAVLFAEKGYEKATTRSIAEAANCSEALIQRYFNGKKGLLLAVLKKENKACDRSTFLERPLCSSLTDEALETFSEAIKRFAERSQQMRIVLSRVLLDPTFRDDFNRISTRNQTITSIEARLTRYADAGMLAPDVDIRSAVELLLSLVFQLGFIRAEIHQAERAEIQRLAKAFAIFFGRAVSRQSLPLRAKDHSSRSK